MNRLLPITIAALLVACTFDPDLGDKYFPCMPDGTCPGGCRCLEGQVCVPDEPEKKLKDCAWCPAGSRVCYDEENAVCARTLSDPEHCGGCWQACPPDFMCEYGACVEWCREGLTVCAGACVDTRNDPYNCGECGHACGPGKVCGLGKCEEVCPDKTINCAGACVDPRTDPAHCGGCGKVCSLDNATAKCEGSACAVLECLEGYQDCDRQAHNGCESCPETDPGNCGECGVACDNPPPPFCEADNLIIYLETGECIDGQCKYQSSPKPCEFGCENGVAGAACKDDPCAEVSCNLHQHCENGGCVCDDLYGDCDTSNLNGCETYLSTPENCGECGFSCGENGICTDGACDCDYGFGNCNNDWSDGCETDTLFDGQNCGSCGEPCETGLTCCDGACVDTNTDRGNCGRCNLFCSGMTECCGGTCTDVQLDPENCGFCGNTCTFPTDTCCWAVCVDISTDPGNCGECGNNCATNIPCHQGTCGAQGIHCGTATCDFYTEECCYGANGIACYPAGSCSVRIVECDDDSDCGDLMHCCLVNTSEHITQCTATCQNHVCSSDADCSDTNPDIPYCCAGDFYGQTINTCSQEFCQ